VVTLRDRSTVEAVRSAEPGFEEFYSAFFHSLTIQMYAYTRDLAAAQDLAQEAFCRAYARWGRVSGYHDPAAWVTRVAWNLATSRWRRLQTAASFLRRQRPEHVEEPSPDRVALAAALATLPAEQRRAVILYHLADLPIGQIARQEGVAENTIKSRLHRGRAALAAKLTEEGKGNA
jgi:RNA polymerase sigma-70 factor (ECF subfamily)